MKNIVIAKHKAKQVVEKMKRPINTRKKKESEENYI